MLKELLSYAKWYEILLKGKTSDKQLNACIYRLNRLETTITRPFFLEVLRLQSEGKLSWPEVRDVFLYTENYLFRRTMCDLPTNALNKIFLMLHREIVRFEGNNHIIGLTLVIMSMENLHVTADGLCDLDDERKAQMVSNLLVVLCGNRDAQPIVNTGSIY